MNKDKNYLINYGLAGVIGILKVIDLHLTYKGMELDENFVEYNPIMKHIVHNKPLIYTITGGYVGCLGASNYGMHKLSQKLKNPELNKITTVGLAGNIVLSIIPILQNIDTLRYLKSKI